MLVVLVRHGETEWSRSHQHTGRTDIILTEEGRTAALALGDRLAEFDFGLVLTSPAARTRETADIAGLGEQAVVDPDLWEWDYGIYEGKRTVDTRKEIPGWSVWTHEIIDGESLEALGRRCDRVIERIQDVDGDVAIFGHGHALRVLAARWIGQPPSLAARLVLSTASVSVLGYERETPVIVAWNEVQENPRAVSRENHGL